MSASVKVTRAELRTPRAAAIAGILFSLLLLTALFILWSTVPADPRETGAWLANSISKVAFALNLIPFAGIAFLWFIGVLRDRLGALEDRFFATVFLGSGILFLAMLFVAAAALGAIIVVFAATPAGAVPPATFTFGRAFAYNIMNIYTVKMAGVFMITTSTLVLRTGVVPRWIAVLGYASALALLFGSQFFDWNFAVFPAWVLLISIYILADNMFRSSDGAAERTA